MLLVDTHGHANFAAFKSDYKEVLQRALEQETWMVMPGTQYDTSRRAVEIAENYGEGVYAAVGLHPIHLSEKRKVDAQEVQSEQARGEPWMTFETKEEEFSYEKYRQLGQSKKVVAVGECGLDYYYEPKSKEKREAQRRKQKAALALQLKLAQELGVPVIFHCRKAHEDLLEILDTRYPPRRGEARPTKLGGKIQDTKIRGVVHCYTGDLKQAERFYELGLFFGFNGLIFRKVPQLPDPKAVIAALPLERILLETDSPYLVPPQAGAERNEPVFVRYVAEEVARLKGVSLEEVASQTTQNAKTLFGLPYGLP